MPYINKYNKKEINFTHQENMTEKILRKIIHQFLLMFYILKN